MEARRLQEVRKVMDREGLDALLIASPYNRRYVTGFSGTAGTVVITRDRAWLVTDFRYTRQALQQAKQMEVVQAAGDPLEWIREQLSAAGVKRLGFEKLQVTYGSYEAYQQQLPGIELVPTEHLIEKLRSRKDEREQEYIRKAVEITDQAFNHILGYLKPGVTERDIAAELEYFMRTHGAVSSAYPTIIASGVRSSLPHGLASDKKLGLHEFVTMDFGASYEGYCSDLTRTVFIGRPTMRHREMYQVVLEANQVTLKGLKPGMTGQEGDSLARDCIASHGYGDYFGHGLGHAFGLEIHELMRLSQSTQEVLEPGMVMTVEPGIYLPDFGGVRIEDDVLITAQGIEVLTTSNKELILL